MEYLTTNWLEEFDKYLTTPREFRPLTTSTIKTEKQRIREAFDIYERTHYAVPNPVYLSILGCVEAYKNPEDRKPNLDNRTRYVPSLSSSRISVYHQGQPGDIGQQLYICAHGTKLSSLEDLQQDIQILDSSITNSVVTLKYILEIINIRNKYDYLANDQIYISGHSLAAVYSLIASYITQSNGYGFNGASTMINFPLIGNSLRLGSQIYSINNIQSYPKYTGYRLARDIVSVTQKWTIPNMVTINVEGLDELSLIQIHSIDTMSRVTIPMVALNQTTISRARNFNDPTLNMFNSRENVKAREGEDKITPFIPKSYLEYF